MPSPQDARPLFRVLDAETGEEVDSPVWLVAEDGALVQYDEGTLFALKPVDGEWHQGPSRYRIEWAAPQGEATKCKRCGDSGYDPEDSSPPDDPQPCRECKADLIALWIAQGERDDWKRAADEKDVDLALVISQHDEAVSAYAEWKATAAKLMGQKRDLDSALAASRSEVAALTEEREAWKLLCEGKDGLLSSYRLGITPTKTTWNKLEKARAKLAALSPQEPSGSAAEEKADV